MNLQQFIATWQNKKVPSRGGITGQCVSLVQQWAQVNGIGGTPVFPVPSAYQMPNSRNDAFTWITNTPTGVPAPGDIVVWNNKVGGGHGHTGVVVSANTKTLDVFQQNDPMGSAAYTKRYNYTNVMGWLKFKQVAQPPKGDDDVITANDRDPIRVISSEVKGWDFDQVHKGTWDSREVAAWTGRRWHDFIMQGWVEGAAFRAARNQKMRDYDVLVKQLADSKTKAEYEAVAAQAKVSAERVAELEKQIVEIQNKPNEDSELLDQTGNWLSKLIARLFKK